MAQTQSDKGFNLEVPLPEELKALLATPICADIALPEPGKVSLTLPSGGTIKGIGDVTRGIPTNCSLNISLMLQLAPILANLECFIRVLKLIKPLIDIVKGLPFPPVKAITDFAEAAKEVTECIVHLTTPTGMIPFVRDILCLIIRMLSCLVQQMDSIVSLMEKLSLSIASAEGNPTEQALLQCAQENAQRAATAQLQSVEPVMVILEMTAPLLEIAGVGAIEIPTMGGSEDVEGMRAMVDTLEQFVETLELVVKALGGCPE